MAHRRFLVDDVFLLKLPFLIRSIRDQAVGDIIFVNIAHVLDRLPPDFLGRRDLHIVKPDIRVKPHFRGFSAEPRDHCRPGIVAGKGKQHFV